MAAANDRQFIAAAFERAVDRAAAEPSGSQTLFVEAVGPGVYAAADETGTWTLAVETVGSNAAVPSVQLAVLNAEFGLTYEFNDGAQRKDIHASVVRCRSHDDAVKDLFATFATAVTEALTSKPTDQEVATEIDRWLSLFWRLQTPPRADVTGLVGEITLIDSASQPAAWVRAWHTVPTSTIDFVFGDGTEIEVKATTRPQRIHDLSLGQVQGRSSERYFASVQVDFRPAGVSVREVLAEVANKMSSDDRFLLWRLVADTCGSSLEAFLSERYIRQFSRDSLAFYRAIEVPQPLVKMPLPTGVARLRFSSDFSSAPTQPAARLLDLEC